MISPCCWIPAALSAVVPGLGARLFRDSGFLTGYGILLFSAATQLVTQLTKPQHGSMCCSTTTPTTSHGFYLPWWWFACVGSVVVLRVVVLWVRTRSDRNLARLAALAK